MRLTSLPAKSATPAYAPGAFALLLAAGTIIAALAFQYFGGYIPCPLCLQQRWAYYAGIPLLFLALVLASGGHERPAALVFFLTSLLFLANAGLGTYHAGAEWKFWPGPDTCGTEQALTTNAGDLLNAAEQTKVIKCDEAQGRFLGLSFPGWNVVASLILFSASLRAAFTSRETR